MNKKNVIFCGAAVVLAGLSLAFSYSTPETIRGEPIGVKPDQAMAQAELPAVSDFEDGAFDDPAVSGDAGAIKNADGTNYDPNAESKVEEATQESQASVVTEKSAVESSSVETASVNKVENEKEKAAATDVKSDLPVAEKQAAAEKQITDETQKTDEKVTTSEKSTVVAQNSSTEEPQKASKDKAADKAKSKQAKQKKLFSYTRMLNYSAHPQTEEFLKEKPLVLNGNKYHIAVTYIEDWKSADDENGDLKKLGFEIDVFENGKKIRNLKLPKVALSPKNIQKGQVLGLAEVAPYNFKIELKDFKVKRKGVSEVLFDFELTS
ncbi:MAG: hypothetical protein HQM10_02200 [Candidatus Riflebacteria bacterium]|nr:hypothetical protein [Candidatus Riflebacteria bacterium]